MKNLLFASSLLLCLFLFTNSILAQDNVGEESDTTYWNTSGFINLNFNQASFTHWAAGGDNSISLTGLGSFKAEYEKERWAWENFLELTYGFIRTGEGVRKNEDRIHLVSKATYEATEKFNYVLLFDFKTQFTEGYNYPDDSVAISDFMSPGVGLLALGMEYQPAEYFTIMLSPATGKITTVLNDEIDETSYGLDEGERVRLEFGASLVSTFDKDIFENVNLRSRLELFNNYTNPDRSNRGNIDVNWETRLNMKINRFLTASVLLHLLYDHDTDVPKTDDDGVDYMGKGLQVKQTLGIGFSYTF